MRRLIAFLVIAAMVSGAVATAATPEFRSADEVLIWIKNYRAKPQPGRVPAAVNALSAMGGFQEPEAAGIYTGFIAGVLGKNPKNAEKLVTAMLAIPPEDHWVIVRAIAYSGLPDWQGLLARAASKMPSKSVMIDAYASGKMPVLRQLTIRENPSKFDKFRQAMKFGKKKQPPESMLEPSPVILDTLWGYYFATGDEWPLDQMIAVLPWSDDHNDAGRLTVGSTAKYGIARYASRDTFLLAQVKTARQNAPPKTAPILDEVIYAAETVDTAKIRDQAQAAINELRLKGPAYKRKVAWWGQLGEGAISLGCVVAAATGAAALGVPCVVGGALTSATLRYFARQS